MWWISKKQKAVALICVGSLFKLSGIIKQDKFTRILILQSPTVTPRCRVSGTIWNCIIHTLPLRPTITKHLIFPAFRHFLFIWKRKRLQKKSKLSVRPETPAAPRQVAAPYKLCASKIVRFRGRMISAPTVHLYYFEQSKTIHRSWFTPNYLPLRKGVEVKFILR